MTYLTYEFLVVWQKIIISKDVIFHKEKFDLKFIISLILLLEEKFDLFINKNILFKNMVKKSLNLPPTKKRVIAPTKNVQKNESMTKKSFQYLE